MTQGIFVLNAMRRVQLCLLHYAELDDNIKFLLESSNKPKLVHQGKQDISATLSKRFFDWTVVYFDLTRQFRSQSLSYI